jgi:hypothetical protein
MEREGKEMQGMHGVFVWEGHDGVYEFLRFYPDGQVLSIRVQSDGDRDVAWSRVRGWFCRNSLNRGVAQGWYCPDELGLRFQLVSCFGTTECEGATGEAGLLDLRLHCQASGAWIERRYQALEVEDEHELVPCAQVDVEPEISPWEQRWVAPIRSSRDG